MTLSLSYIIVSLVGSNIKQIKLKDWLINDADDPGMSMKYHMACCLATVTLY